MMVCNSPKARFKTCVAEMDAFASQGGTICCDTAEGLDFDVEQILKQCGYAEREEEK